MNPLTLYQVDAFANHVFGGNPAAVVPLERWLPDSVMQQFAVENNLSETAFFIPSADEDHDYDLRWFSPLEEVDLCGHATLAAAFVLYQKLGFAGETLKFTSRSGTLTVVYKNGEYTMDFPVWPISKVTQHTGLQRALGAYSREIYQSLDWLMVLESADQLRALTPNFAALRDLEGRGVIVTAPGEGGIDFFSRAFFPKLGIDEDPVTGSAHCALTPYWARRLGKPVLRAQQLSKRRGDLVCQLIDNRVRITGTACLFMEATCYLPE